jgi:hypothetical protein
MAIGAAGLAAFKQREMDEDEVDESEAGEADEHEAEDELEVMDEEGFSDFVDAIYEAASDLEAAAQDVGEDLTHDNEPSAEATSKIKEQLASMPAPIVEGIADFLKGMAWENVCGIAEGMEEAGLIDDTDQVCGWLYWAAKQHGEAHEAAESSEEEEAEHEEGGYEEGMDDEMYEA